MHRKRPHEGMPSHGCKARPRSVTSHVLRHAHASQLMASGMRPRRADHQSGICKILHEMRTSHPGRGGNPLATRSFAAHRNRPKCLIFRDGRVAEWLKAAVLKTARAREGPRGFESHPFRQRGIRSRPSPSEKSSDVSSRRKTAASPTADSVCSMQRTVRGFIPLSHGAGAPQRRRSRRRTSRRAAGSSDGVGFST